MVGVDVDVIGLKRSVWVGVVMLFCLKVVVIFCFLFCWEICYVKLSFFV